MVNKVILIGNLGRDPEVRQLEGGQSMARFSIATNENYQDKAGNWQKQTEWHNVVAWRFLAERAEKQLKKGTLIYLEGKLTTRKWQDQNGNDKYTTEVVARTIRILERRESDEYRESGVSSKSAPIAGGHDDFPTIEQTSNTESISAPVEDDLPF